MSTRFEYMSAAHIAVEYLDERLLSVENPEAQDVLCLSADEVSVITGTKDELTALAVRIIRVLGLPPLAFEGDPDPADDEEAIS
jgi:hypothetical protein